MLTPAGWTNDPSPPHRAPDAAGAAFFGVFSGLGLAGGAAATVVGGVLAWIGWVVFGWGESMLNGDDLYAVVPGIFVAMFGGAAGLVGGILLLGGLVAAGLGGLAAWAAARRVNPP